MDPWNQFYNTSNFMVWFVILKFQFVIILQFLEINFTTSQILWFNLLFAKPCFLLVLKLLAMNIHGTWTLPLLPFKVSLAPSHHVASGILVNIGLGCGHYLRKYWHMVHKTHSNLFKWNFQNSNIKGNSYENVFNKISAIISFISWCLDVLSSYWEGWLYHISYQGQEMT